MIHHGDCLEVMAGMEPESVDAIVTDPPYGLGFMGKAWDGPAIAEAARKDAATRKSVGPHSSSRPGRTAARSSSAFGSAAHYAGPVAGGRPWQDWCYQWAEAAYRVAKPSAYLLAFGGTRTVHRMTVAIEDAGWIIRDMLVWAYASGFPKSKASLKPAWEPIVMARKPGPLRMLAIDACRIAAEPIAPFGSPAKSSGGILNRTGAPREQFEQSPLGRWPANVILTDPIFDGGVEGVVGGGDTSSGSREGTYAVTGYSKGWGDTSRRLEGDSGTYSRFFLIPKASRTDREPRWSPATSDTGRGASVRGSDPLLGEPVGAGARSDTSSTGSGARPSLHTPDSSSGLGRRALTPESLGSSPRSGATRRNVHPTVKPVDLMRHLVRLVTPPGGTVLDPFLGSGTTGLACELEGFPWIGIEKEAESVAIAEARLNGTQRGLGLGA